MNEHKVYLENNIIMINDTILAKIPALFNIVNENIKYSNPKVLHLEKIDNTTFSYILTLVEYNISNSKDDCDKFNNTFVHNMELNNLINFIYATNKLDLQTFNTIASSYFVNIFKQNDINELRAKITVANDISDINNTKLFDIMTSVPNTPEPENGKSL